MSGRNHHQSDGTSRTDRRRLLEAGGLLAGAAALFGGAPAAGAADRVQFNIRTRRNTMPTWRPDPTFYPSPRSAMQAPAEDAGLRRPRQSDRRRPARRASCVVDVDPTSTTYGTIVGRSR